MNKQPENRNKIILGDRIRQRREELNLSRNKVAKQIGVSLSTLQSWEIGEREPSATHIMLISNILQTSVSWLFGEKEITSNIHEEKNLDNDFVYIPRYNIQASAGHGAWAESEKTNICMAFRKYWIDNYIRAKKEDLSIITVRGDSMEGVLNDRDLLLINHADKDPREGIYVLRIDGHLIVKQLQRLPDSKIKVVSSNTNYDPFIIDLKSPPMDFEIIGRVVWFGRAI